MLTSDSFQAKREILKFLYPGKTVFASLALLWPSLFASTFLCATLSLPPRTHGVVPHFSSRPPMAARTVCGTHVGGGGICNLSGRRGNRLGDKAGDVKGTNS